MEEAKSGRALKREKKELSDREILSRAKRETEKERKAFLEEILSEAEYKFKHYERGYRTFSIKCPKDKHFSIDDKILTTIIDEIPKKYECEFKSFALTEAIYPKSYTFVFYKEAKK